MISAYKEFKQEDLELYNISLNAKKFSVDFTSNMRILEILFAPREIIIDESNLEKIAEIFTALEEIRDNSQLSK
ncbi:hypothetical protein Q4Y15_001110 [Campylobacter fetus]|uniref:Uncharacterized protein n=3 Tax=Campylobacter fetus TaxID=196 RepID=A0A5L4K9Z6_CAMFE|nr:MULTISPECIES: hypothetical protein [Campylobacter]OCS22597.1 hypothetical protein CFVI97532_03250 [Campylobacter fetus subsp. venerealis cfvi97/532]OCS26975.1 hypothetical protein CFVB10_01990 [Campylobacter fetus subsp. venerealis cfvB10]OCS30108.1 hypothetical protein CFVCCUG33900_03540 [Campylobacter fetus subsp. venerealis LMG 6570 = CCUG 33900]OCS43330.1 hypothetical protein CFVI02298_00170 [Campylobacter fetus subsp. venerealis cfvi02/298]ABK82521.1 hypothetical protein CFF8240_1443 [